MRLPIVSKFFLVLLLALALGFIARVGVAEDRTFVVNTTAGPPHYFEDGSGFINQLVSEIFRRLEIEHRLIWLPAERSLVFTSDGTVDAMVPRASAVEAKYKNLLRVPVEVFEFEFVAYTKHRGIKLDGWKSLQPYAVGLINGWKIVEQNVADSRVVLKANDYEQLLTLLQLERVDVAILDRVMGGWAVKQLGFDLGVVAPPMATVPTYFYVHEKHAELVPRLTRIILEMKRDGTYDRIIERTLSGYVKP